MIKFDHEVFYNSYAYDYYIYKLGTLKAILSDVQKFDKKFLSNHVQRVNYKNYSRFIKSELRMTCFHAIETLFELVFALEPINGMLRDEKILHSLTTANPNSNYLRIGKIANDSSELDFLDVICAEGQEVPVWLHIFYFQIHPKYKNDLLESGNAIKYFLSTVATIFSNRSEYNAYKHGIRIMNTLVSFSIGTKFNKNDEFSIDLTDTMSLFSIEKDGAKNPIAEIVDVIPFNTERDIEIIQICYHIIHNIINCRREFYATGSTSDEALTFTEAKFRELLNSGYSSVFGNSRARNPI